MADTKKSMRMPLLQRRKMPKQRLSDAAYKGASASGND
jgi:hypothetical protein